MAIYLVINELTHQRSRVSESHFPLADASVIDVFSFVYVAVGIVVDAFASTLSLLEISFEVFPIRVLSDVKKRCFTNILTL